MHPTLERLPITSRRCVAALVVVVSAALMASAAAASAGAPPVPQPRTPAHLPVAIEAMGGYVEQTACDPVIRPGTRKLATLLASTYRSFGGSTWMSTYACGTDGTRSEHYEGRAIDWMVSVTNARQHEAAMATLHWLLATDAQGNQFAMARRLGIMYLIYDNRIWGAWDGQWQPYGNCAHEKSAAYANACHRTHIHISLTWNGAMGRTTFWTGKVWPTDYGPCRPADLNWAASYTGPNYSPCPVYPQVTAPKGASATKRALVEFSGARVYLGSSGPVVSAVQSALHLAVTGEYGPSTVSGVRAWQRTHHLVASGVMNQPTWVSLLAHTR